jgi:hypothetical protein
MFLLVDSQKYKDVIEAVDIVQDMTVQCQRCESSLIKLEEYLNQKRDTRVSVSEENRKKDADTGRQLSAIISAIPVMFATLHSSDFSSTTSRFLDSVTSLRQIRSRNTASGKQLVIEVEKSLNHLKSFVALAAANELEKLPENESLVLSALVSLIIVNRQTFSQTFDTLLASVSSSIRCHLVPAIHSLSHAIVQYHAAQHFLLRITSDMFLADQPLNLIAYITRKYEGVDCGDHLSDQEIRKRMTVWWKQQETFLQQVLPEFLRNQTAADVLVALQKLSEYNSTDRRSVWESNTEVLLGNKICFWSESLKDKFVESIRISISRTIDDSVSSLSLSQIADSGTINVSSSVWAPPKDQNSFELRKCALIPELMTVIESFRTKLSHVRENISLLVGDRQNTMHIIPEKDWESLRSMPVELFDAKLSAFLENMVEVTKMQSSKILPACFLVRSIALLHSDLNLIYSLHPDPNRWIKMRANFLHQSYAWLSTHYHMKIENSSPQLLRVSDLSVEQMTESSLPWEEIVLQDSNETGVTSVIRTPTYTSVSFMEFLTAIAREVNRISGHGLPDEVSVAILVKAGTEIIRVYEETLDRIQSSHLPTSLLQRKCLQCYYDLLFTKAILTPVKNDPKRSVLLPKLVTLIKSFESRLDPFDLHLMSSTVQRNVYIAIRNSNHVLCLFVPESVLESIKNSSDSKASASTGNDNLRPKQIPPLLPLLPLPLKK